ncbi:MAG: hypothetical protein E2O39_13200, partial [Planctomycetota bacterium]
LFGVLAALVVTLLLWAPWEPASNARAGTLPAADAAREAIELLSAQAAADALELADPGTGPWSAVAAFTPGVRLRGDGRLVGTVLDRGTGAGVPGLAVQLFALPPAGIGMLDRMLGLSGLGGTISERVRPVATATTDAMGGFEFSGVREGTWFVDVAGDHHVPETVRKVRVLASGAGGPVELWVRAGGRVLGQVLLPDGGPAVGAKVMLTPGVGTAITAAGTGEYRLIETRADEGGRFAFPAVPPMEGYEVTAYRTGLSAAHANDILVAAGRDVELVLGLRLAGTVVGRILSAAGVTEDGSGGPGPLSGVRVGAVPRGLRDLRFAKEILARTHGVSAADGTFVLSGVPIGVVDVLALADGHVPGKGPFVRVTEGGRHDVGDFVIERGPVVRGRVVDSGGAPIPGVMIGWNPVDYAPLIQGDPTFAPLLAQAMRDFEFPVTDAEGRFVAGAFPGKPEYGVFVYKPGYEDLRFDWDPGRDGDEVEIVMHRGGGIEGIVMDLATAEPVTTFTIETSERIELAAGDPSRINPFAGGEVFETTDGRFRLAAVRTGPVTLVVSAPGYVDSIVAGISVTEGEVTRGVIVLMSPGATVRGVVVDSDGKALAGVHVTTDVLVANAGDAINAQRSGFLEYIGDRVAPRTVPFLGFVRYSVNLGLIGEGVVTTDGAGRFELGGLPAGAHRVLAIHRDYSMGEHGPVTLEPGGELDGIVITLTQGGGLFGKVTDRFDRPLAGSMIVAFAPTAFDTKRATTGLYQGHSGAQGDYRIEHMEPGAYLLVLMRDDESLNPLSLFGSLNFGMVTVPPTEPVRYDIRDAGAGACRVWGVVTANGVPVDGGGLVATSFESESLLGFELKMTRLGSRGEYEFPGLPPGEYRFRLDGIAHRITMSVDVPDEPEMRIDLAVPFGSVAGVVLDAQTREPVQGAYVSLKPAGRAGPTGLFAMMIERDGRASSYLTGPGGSFIFDFLQAGEYELNVFPPTRGEHEGRYAAAEPLALTLAEDEELEGVEVALEPALVLSGVVRNALGDPLEAATLYVRFQDDLQRGRVSAWTDEEGRFDVPTLAPGTYIVTAAAAGYAKRTLRDVVVAEGETDELEITLEEGLEVEVRVFAFDGTPVAGATARLIRAGDDAQEQLLDVTRAFRSFFAGKATTDADGRLELGNYAPGSYTLEVRRAMLVTTKKVELEGGGSVVLRVTLR